MWSRRYIDRQVLWLFGFALVLALLFAWEASSVRFAVDDAYITFSYSKNLARGAGPVYGHGVRVEGYSNFLWMVLVAIPLAFRNNADPLVVARGISIGFAGVLLVSTYLLARVRASRLSAFVAAALVGANVNVVLAFESGLETLPYAALITAGFMLHARSGQWPAARRYFIAVFLAAALMRIDGFIPLGFIIAFDATAAWLERRFSFREQLRRAAPAVAVWGAWFLWRWHYYGLPLPTTYYAKALIPVLMPRRGLEYVFDELAGSGLFVALIAFGYLLWRRYRPALAIGLFSVGQLAYAVDVGGDWMPSARFLLAAYPLLVVLMVWGAAELVTAARSRGQPIHAVAALGCLAVFAWVAERTEPHVTTNPYVAGKLGLAAGQAGHVSRLKRAARYLSLVVPPGGRLVTDYGGVLAYYTEAAPIEMWGLCNAEIATKGDTERVNPEYGRTCPRCYADLDPEYFHVVQPLVRSVDAFQNHAAVVRAVWQSDTIGRYVNFRRDFVSGRIRNRRNGEAVWFLERVRGGRVPRPRALGDTVIEYPFVQGGLLDEDPTGAG